MNSDRNRLKIACNRRRSELASEVLAQGTGMISLTITVDYGALEISGSDKQPGGRPMVRRDIATIILVDSDLSFAFWLGRALDGEGYNAFPARNGSDALELLSTIQPAPSLVILGSIQAGAADVFIARCRALNAEVRILQLLDAGESGGDHANADEYQWLKSASRSPEDSAELLRIVRRLLTSPTLAAGSEY